MALVRACFRIEDDDAPIAVTIGDVELASRGVDVEIGRAAEVRRVVAAPRLPAAADLQQKLAVERELEYLRILVAVAGEPDGIGLVDEDAVLARGPLVSRARTAPRAHDVARLIEHEHGRRRYAATPKRRILCGAELALAERRGALHDPDVVARVDGDAGDLPEQPVVRQRLRPERVDLKLWHTLRRFLRAWRARDERRKQDEGSRWAHARHRIGSVRNIMALRSVRRRKLGRV